MTLLMSVCSEGPLIICPLGGVELLPRVSGSDLTHLIESLLRESAQCHDLCHTSSPCHKLPATHSGESHTVSHAVSHTPNTWALAFSSGSLAPS